MWNPALPGHQIFPIFYNNNFEIFYGFFFINLVLTSFLDRYHVEAVFLIITNSPITIHKFLHKGHVRYKMWAEIDSTNLLDTNRQTNRQAKYRVTHKGGNVKTTLRRG